MLCRRSVVARIALLVVLVAFLLSVAVQVFALERKLAGVSLGERMSFVLKKYGNPTRVSIGAGSGPTMMGMGAQSTNLGPPEMAGGGRMRPMPVRDVSPFAGMGLGGGQLPGLSSVGGPPGASTDIYGPNSPGAPFGGVGNPNAANGQGNDAQSASEDVRWIYEIPKKPTLEFIINEGIVAQITVSGPKWAMAKTAKGATLGDSYKKVLLSYGYPDTQDYVGRYLRVGYLQTNNILFTLRDSKTVVGITIGLKE